MDTRVISKIQERLERDDNAFKRVLQSFGISKKPSRFSSIIQFFPDTPVTMLKDVFEALQLYDLLELLESRSIKPHRSLQLAYTLDEIKKLNGVADLPTTYHSCGAVLIITDDENVSSASAIKTLFTDLDNKSDVTEILTQEIPTLRHLFQEINAMILEISARFARLLEEETQRRLKDALDRFKLTIRKRRSEGQTVLVRVVELMADLDKVRTELYQIIFSSQSESKTELRQTDELKGFFQSMMVTAERIQENLSQLIERGPEWVDTEEGTEEQNFRENVSAVINRWIHRQG